MNPRSVRAAAFGIGVVAGLRTLLAPAVLAYAAHNKVVGREFPLAALVSRPVSRKLMKLAASELLADKLPFTPKRISPGPLGARIASGAACGAVLSYVAKESVKEGALLGGAGALTAAFAGYYARKSLSRKHSGLAVALVEDGLAITVAAGIALRVAQEV